MQEHHNAESNLCVVLLLFFEPGRKILVRISWILRVIWCTIKIEK